MIVVRGGQEFLKAKEMLAKYRATRSTPKNQRRSSVGSKFKLFFYTWYIYVFVTSTINLYIFFSNVLLFYKSQWNY